MQASQRQQELLLALQDLDHAAARLRRKAAQLPERSQLAALQSEVEAAKQEFMAVQRELDTQHAEIARVESDTDMVRQRKDRDDQLLLVSTSPKEAQALQDEVATLTRRQAELEDRQLELMEVNEQTQARFDAASQVLNSVDARRTELTEALAKAEARIAAELSDAIAEREGVAAEVERELLGHYETLRARIGIGAARLRGRISEASNMELAPAELGDILSAAPDELIHCPQSGAILVRVPEPSE